MSSSSKKLKIGVIGAGMMGDHHARIYSTLPGVKLAGITDVDEERGKAAAEKYKTKFFPSIDSLLEKVDAVTISTPTSTHFEISTKVLDAGKHLLVEKPLAKTAEEGERIVALAKEKNLILAVGLIERFNPAFLALKRILIKERPLIIDFKRFSPFPERISDVSVVFDMMIHDIDLAFDLARAEIKEFKAEGRKERTKFLDQAFVNIFFDCGLIVNIEANRVHDKKERSIRLNCEDKNIEVDLLNKKVFKTFLPDLNLPLAPVPPKRVPVLIADQLTLELKDFVVSIKRGGSPQVSGDDGLRALKFALEVEKKAKRGSRKKKKAEPETSEINDPTKAE